MLSMSITKKNSLGKFSRETNQLIDLVVDHEVLTFPEQLQVWSSEKQHRHNLETHCECKL